MATREARARAIVRRKAHVPAIAGALDVPICANGIAAHPDGTTAPWSIDTGGLWAGGDIAGRVGRARCSGLVDNRPPIANSYECVVLFCNAKSPRPPPWRRRSATRRKDTWRISPRLSYLSRCPPTSCSATSAIRTYGAGNLKPPNIVSRQAKSGVALQPAWCRRRRAAQR